MEHWIEMAITIICSVFASSGFWAFMQKRSETKDAKYKMILGLGHDRIKFLCEQHIKQGWISTGDYEDLRSRRKPPRRLPPCPKRKCALPWRLFSRPSLWRRWLLSTARCCSSPIPPMKTT